MGNPFTFVLASGFSSADSGEKALIWSYLKAREPVYNDEPIVGNAFDFVIADAKTILGPSFALTHLQQQLGNMAVHK